MLQKSATVAENGETTATVAEFGDSRTNCRTFLRQCGQAFTTQTQHNLTAHHLVSFWYRGEVVASCRIIVDKQSQLEPFIPAVAVVHPLRFVVNRQGIKGPVIPC